MTCNKEVESNIQRVYGLNTIDLPLCDQLFDLNNDGKINMLDGIIFGQMTEEEYCTLMNEYNNCLNPIVNSHNIILLTLVIGIGLFLLKNK